jgi:hypothetical protein
VSSKVSCIYKIRRECKRPGLLASQQFCPRWGNTIRSTPYTMRRVMRVQYISYTLIGFPCILPSSPASDSRDRFTRKVSTGCQVMNHERGLLALDSGKKITQLRKTMEPRHCQSDICISPGYHSPCTQHVYRKMLSR